MALVLDTFFSDFRLYNLFDNNSYSVTQIWIFEINRSGNKDHRFIYGRTLPNTYKSDEWQIKSSQKTELYKNCTIKIITLTLYTSGDKIKKFFEAFINGISISEASHLAEIILTEKNTSIGSVIFGANPTMRPVMHFPTRDYFSVKTNRLSPSSDASADSGAIFSDDKQNIFSIPEGLDQKIADVVCSELNTQTGLDFKNLDSWRLGDFELICLPGLNRFERKKFDIELKNNISLKIFEPLTYKETDLTVVFNTYSDDVIKASYIKNFSKNTPYPLSHTFTTEDNKIDATAFTMEIYATCDTNNETYLQLQIGNHFIRSVNLSMHFSSSIHSPITMGWLEKQVPVRDKAKVEAASHITRAINSSNSQIGEHTNDPWVNYNRLAQDNTHRLFPKNSTGRFFPTLSESKGTSRLSLSDWLRNIFNRYQDAKIAWIDPFMEDAGIEILHRMGTSKGDYLIITTEKQQKEEDCIKANQPNRISKLLLSCEEWGKGYFGNVKLKVLTVPEGKLHDRMILIRAENDEPLAGYHLSNSIQRANENFPLLATPIPLDVLPDVFKFTDEIIQSTLDGDVKGPTPTASLIFDSTKYKILVKENLERFNKQQFFLDVPRSGDVLAWWLNDQEFEGIYGSTLSDLMQKKGYLKDDQLNSEQFDSLPHKFFIEGFPLADFHSAWDAAGYILANSRAGDSFRMGESSSLPDKLKKLLFNHLDPFRVNALPTKLKSSHIDIEFYRNKSLTELLFSNNVPERVFQDSLIETSWSDYYAIKLLWLNSPRDFIDWLSQMCFSPSIEPYRKLVLIIQTFKFISLSLRFNKDLEKIDLLIKSQSDMVRWIGIHAFKDLINECGFNADMSARIDFIESNKQQEVLCWLISEANDNNANETKLSLVNNLIQSIKSPLTDEQLQSIIQSLQGRFGKIYRFTPWILETVLIPMFKLNIINVGQVAREWLNELIKQWGNALKGEHLNFKIESEGAFTDEFIILMNFLSFNEQIQIINQLQRLFNSLARVIRKPLSAQVNYSLYANAYEVNIWLYTLVSRIASSFLSNNQSINGLLDQSESLLKGFSVADWNDLSQKELFKYLVSNPEQLEDHHLLGVIKVSLSA